MSKQIEPSEMAEGEAQVIRQPGLLRAKVAKAPPGDAEAVFAAADKAVLQKADLFIEHARDELGAMRTALHQAVTVAEKRAESLDRVYTMAHDLKGQGTSFGYELITRVGALLCQYLKARRANDAQGLRVVAAHIEALGLIVEHRITGAGGKLGTEMITRLEKLVGTAKG
jgi:chemotaxis protein histidine kinase CheA